MEKVTIKQFKKNGVPFDRKEERNLRDSGYRKINTTYWCEVQRFSLFSVNFNLRYNYYLKVDARKGPEGRFSAIDYQMKISRKEFNEASLTGYSISKHQA
jgi:hypothetical protein